MARSRQGAARPGLFDADTFSGFGPSRFRPVGEDSTGHAVRGRGERRLHEKVREHAPRVPGVYGMLDARGRIVYVGKAKCLRARLMSYFRANSRDPKAGRILSHTRVLVWEHAADEFAALLRELELIRRFRPRFNVLGQPGPRRYVYLCLGKTPAPYVYLTREPTGKEVGCYGPLVGRGTAHDAVRRMNDWFKLRDCPSTQRFAFADQTELFPADRGAKCLRYEIGNCLGPCGGGHCTRKEYSAGVRAAKAFLDGKDRAVLESLAKQMTAAAAELRFEQAMAVRDRLQSLTWLSDRLAFLRSARRANSFVYPLEAASGTVWYLIHHGEVQGAVRAPATPEEREAAAGLIEAAFARPAPPGGIDDKCVDSVLLVTGWFRKYRDEKAKLLSKPDALSACVL